MPVVLALGLDPACVDPKAMGGFSAPVVRAYLDSQMARIRTLGYEVETCYVDRGETAERVLTEQLRQRPFDCVMIGAGVRDDTNLRLFEKLLNIVHALAPRAKICFNSSPTDSAEAVQRWV
ncbi:MAG TPA: hypothetical protein VH814_19440 [Steroidobacteraceae bacterium]|jgi:hypothetical protein